jgi:hypothetical protein
MNTSLKRTGCVLALSALSTLVQAEAIGRTELYFNNEFWRYLTGFETSLKFNGGTVILPMDNKVFYLLGPDRQPRALLVVTSTRRSFGGSVNWISGRCPDAHASYHTDDFGSNGHAHSQQCLIVNSAFATFKYFQPDSPVLAAARDNGIELFKSGYSIRSTYGSPNGSFVRASLFTRTSFQGFKGTPARAQDLHDVPPALVAWGEALHKAVSDSLLSMRGILELPPTPFQEVTPPDAAASDPR